MADELSLDEIEEALAQPDPKPKSTRKSKSDDRTIMGWIRMPHTVQRNCEVPNHDEDERPRDKGVTTIVNDVAVCRICFLASKDLHP